MYCFEDVDLKLVFDFNKAEHEKSLLCTFKSIFKNLIDLSQRKLVSTDQSIFVIKKNSIEKVEWFSIHVSAAVASSFVIVSLNYVTMREVQGRLQIKESVRFHQTINAFENLLITDFLRFMIPNNQSHLQIIWF